MSASAAPESAVQVEQLSERGSPSLSARTVQPDPLQVRDVAAQEDMAYWAMLTFYVGIASAAFALLALVGIATDIWLNRRRTRIEQRPWLTLKAELKGPVVLGDTVELGNQSLKFRFNVTIRNVGSTPARKAFLEGKLFNVLRGGDDPEHFIQERLAQARKSKATGFMLGPNEEITKLYQMALPCGEFGVQPDAHGKATYPMAVFSVCYGATSDAKLLGQTAKGILLHCADWVHGHFECGSVELEEIEYGEANNIGTAT